MRGMKVLSGVLGILGVLLILFTVVMSFRAIHAPARILFVSEEAQEVTEDFMGALASGNYGAMESMVLGQPELEPDAQHQSALGRILWGAYSAGISYEFDGDIYISDAAYYRNVKVRTLDVAGVMMQLKQRIQPALDLRASEMDRDLIVDENGEYREDFIMDTLCQLALDLLEEEPGYVTRTITLALVYQDGQWWIRPDQNLMNILSGGL